MTGRNVARGALIVVSLAAPTILGADGQGAPARQGGIYDQLAISLPDGWNVYDQSEALSGKPSPLGVVFFSAQAVTPPGSATASAPLLAKVDTGEVASFFVDRSKATKGMSCLKLSRSDVYNIGTTINRDPAIATGGRRLLGGLEPSHTDITIGGCHGVRFQLEAHKDDPAKHWKIDARAVSDGKVLYLFSVRHRGVYFDDSLAVFEQALNTVKFTQAN